MSFGRGYITISLTPAMRAPFNMHYDIIEIVIAECLLVRDDENAVVGQLEKTDLLAVSASSDSLPNRGPSRGPRRARCWRGGVPTDVHRASDESKRRLTHYRKSWSAK